MKKKIKKFFRWIFKAELENLETKINEISRLKSYFEIQNTQISKILKKLENTVVSIDVSVDVHETPYAESWAVISIQGKNDFIKFINLGQSDLREIQHFLRQFDRNKIDATPQNTHFLRVS